MPVALFFLLFIVTFGLGTTRVLGQLPPRTSVPMGRDIGFRLTGDVNPETVRITVVPQRIARARLDTEHNRFVIEGVEQGVARITFTGTSRYIAVAGANERTRPFRHVVDVTVLPPDVRIDSRVMNIEVSRGSYKDYKLEVLVGMAFSKANEEGYRWRNVSLADGNTRVAEGLYDNNQMKLRISGIDHGRTTLMLRGQRSEKGNGVWQDVVREIRVKVGTGVASSKNKAPGEPKDMAADSGGHDKPPDTAQTNEMARDKFIDAIERTYNKLKSAVDGAAADPNKRAAAESELNSFIAYLESQIDNEESRRPPSAERIAKLGDLLDLSKQLFASLQQSAAPSGSIGEIWSSQAKPNEMSKVCPANPRRELAKNKTVYFGGGKYFVLSPVCLAAAHAGKITFEQGGTVKWRMVDVTLAEVQASSAAGAQSRNGVQAATLVGTGTKIAFTFID